MVCLATAHPAKFGEAVARALGRGPDIPPSVTALESLERRCETVPNDLEAVKTFLSTTVS
nr:hypothetical protein [Desulfuromonas sp.]